MEWKITKKKFVISAFTSFLITAAIYIWDVFYNLGIPYFLHNFSFGRNLMMYLLLFAFMTICILLLICSSQRIHYLGKGAQEGSHIDARVAIGASVAGQIVTLFHSEDSLCVYTCGMQDEQNLIKRIPYKQIVDVESFTEKELLEKKKSTVGRMVVGGLLMGDIGALIGYLDAQNPKIKEKETQYLLLHYLNYDNAEQVSTIAFSMDPNITWGLHNFIQKFSEHGVKRI